ncbi:MAG: ROK family protein [Fusobacteriaceae bacterium]
MRAILFYLKTYGASSRKQIAESLKLTTATLTILTTELIEQGYLLELGEITDGKVGRKQILIDVNPDFRFAFGLEITIAEIFFTIVNLKSDIILKKNWKYENKISKILFKEIFTFIKKYNIEFEGKVLGLGVSVPGFIEEGNSEVLGIKKIKEYFQENLKIENIIVENNVRALTLTELYFEKEKKDFWLIKYGPGLGSSIVLNGELIRGNTKRAGEIGHVPYDNNSLKSCQVCRRKGCLESAIHVKNIDDKNYDSDLKEKIDILVQYVSVGYVILDPEFLILAGEIFLNKKNCDYFRKKMKEKLFEIDVEKIVFMEYYEIKRTIAPCVLVLNKFYK